MYEATPKSYVKRSLAGLVLFVDRYACVYESQQLHRSAFFYLGSEWCSAIIVECVKARAVLHMVSDRFEAVPS